MALNRDETGLIFRLDAETKGVEQKVSSLRSVLNSELDSIQNAAQERLGRLGEVLNAFGLRTTETITDTAKLADAQRLFESQSNSLFASLANRTKLTLDSTKELLDTYRKLPDASARNAFAIQQFGDRALALTPALEGASQRLTRMEQGFEKSSAAATTTATGLSTIGLVAGGAVVAIGAVTAGLVASTQAAADFGGDIFDLTQKTAASAETLSALKVVAEQSGSSLEPVSGALVRLNKNLADARAGNKELADTFRILGVDLEGSVDDALRVIVERFAQLPDGATKTRLAMELFGKSGADLIPTLNSLEGNLDANIEKMKALGLTINNETAAAADEFGDTVQLLGQRLEGLKIRIGNLVIPSLSQLASSFDRAIAGIESSYNSLPPEVRAVIFAGINAQTGGIAALGRTRTPSSDGEDQITGADFARNDEAIAERQKADALARDLTNKDRKTGGGGRSGGGRSQTREEAAPDDFDQRLREVFIREQQERERRNREAQKADQEFYREITRSREAFNRQQAEIQRINDDAEIAAIQEQAQRRIITGQEAVVQIASIRAAAFAQREDELNAIVAGGDVTAVAAAQQELLKLSAERAAFEADAIRKLRSAKDADLEQEQQDIQERIRLIEELQAKIREIALADPSSNLSIFGDFGGSIADQTASQFQGMVATITDALAQTNDALGNFESIAVNAFGNIANGLGNMLAGFIATGQTGPAAFRRLAAGVIASVAAQSAVKAIFEIAEGFAALARFDPVSASQHFAAAKFYGVVAGVATAAGLALGATAGGGDQNQQNGTGGNRFERRERRVIEQGERERQEPVILILRQDPGIIVEHVTRDYRLNGNTRTVIRQDGV